MASFAAEYGRVLELPVDGEMRRFDIDDPDLPDWVDDNVLTSGDYPYDERMDRDAYNDQLRALQEQLVLLQSHIGQSGERIIAVFEGRDAAGKGGTISRFRQYLNPRNARAVALPKPSDRERGQWYFQRYVDHFPTESEIIAFDRSWYNRGGVEPVMGFCTPEQHTAFLGDAPNFERIIVDEGIHFFKFWLNIGRETQLKRFHDRRHSTLKHWKLSDIDIVGMHKWDDYTRARNRMIAATHTRHAPWTVVRFNDKRRGRIEVLRHILTAIPFEGRDMALIGEPDPRIVGEGLEMLDD
ncbi:polyphosphate kinase 2 [Oceaniradius stylonematis]|uniref:ADP/GDP-polyphosphate phosphotransferase n=1 Tax=Oceaniradius stylonematis TaxID=2184161 RepID=A0A3A8AB47_9HYPH|nr:polyphosphate kinase 2 [Oceaniradius stylonematis]RKF07146.1 polyphosphate kinase 2 [Oceaniradius stylonematis]RNC96497.1 MAG: polyphosphate kinase 2 [Oricola sp.]